MAYPLRRKPIIRSISQNHHQNEPGNYNTGGGNDKVTPSPSPRTVHASSREVPVADSESVVMFVQIFFSFCHRARMGVEGPAPLSLGCPLAWTFWPPPLLRLVMVLLRSYTLLLHTFPQRADRLIGTCFVFLYAISPARSYTAEGLAQHHHRHHRQHHHWRFSTPDLDRSLNGRGSKWSILGRGRGK